jgi:Copper binding proteins, plastocyanin/azurin family
MIRIRHLAVAAACTVSACVLTGVAQAAPPLIGTVGPAFTITLTQGGKRVTALKAGTYTTKVADKSNIHNFHLRGPGVNKSTSVPGTGTSTWTVKLKKGTYRYVCDPHASIMKGSFRVT